MATFIPLIILALCSMVAASVGTVAAIFGLVPVAVFFYALAVISTGMTTLLNHA